MNKDLLLQHIIKQLEIDLAAAIEAAQATYQAATHEESKPENEYDTRGLEASYLAGAQAKRAAEIEETLYVFKNSKIRLFTKEDSVAVTALVEIKLENKPPTFVLIMPKGGGHVLKFNNQTIQVVTPNSPLGEALVNSKQGDFVVIESGSQTREYEILSVE